MQESVYKEQEIEVLLSLVNKPTGLFDSLSSAAFMTWKVFFRVK